MKITVDIPKNDYVQPTEVRQEVVQYICEAFLSNWTFGIFHQNANIVKTQYVRVSKNGKVQGFVSNINVSDNDYYFLFNGDEMKAAFKVLREAGYHMFRVCACGGAWMGYICKKKPFSPNGEEVTTFNDFID